MIRREAHFTRREYAERSRQFYFCVIKAGIYKVKMETKRVKRKSRWESIWTRGLRGGCSNRAGETRETGSVKTREQERWRGWGVVTKESVPDTKRTEEVKTEDTLRLSELWCLGRCVGSLRSLNASQRVKAGAAPRQGKELRADVVTVYRGGQKGECTGKKGILEENQRIRY